MAKKKQPDFQKTKLKVGKRLPKGKNVTNTSFKSKKIVTKEQKFKIPEKDVSLIDLLSLVGHTNVANKIKALKSIGKFVEKNIYTLASYFSSILKVVGGVLLENFGSVRREAIDLIKGCLEPLSSSQLNCFMPMLISYMNCMMTHIDNAVRKDSLDLLYAVLRVHPNLICHSTQMLNCLLNMISSVDQQKKDVKGQVKRKLNDNINNNMTSVEWRDQVLKLIGRFLETLIDGFHKENRPTEDEQKVYWDNKRPLFVALYASGGLAPTKLDMYSPCDMKSETGISKELRVFFDHILPLSIDIITEETASLQVVSGCKMLKPDYIHRLNTVTQVICHLGEWFKLNYDDEIHEDSRFLDLISNAVCKKLMKGFSYFVQESALRRHDKSNETDCLHLNFGICYLYNTFILGTKHEEADKEIAIIACLCSEIARVSPTDIRSVTLILKSTENFIQFLSTSKGERKRKLYEVELSNFLSILCSKAGLWRDTEVAKLIQSFFIKLSLDYEYGFLLNSDGMQKWIKYLFQEMMCMKMDKKANKKLLKCINQICNREYPYFLKQLRLSKPKDILDFLKLEDEDYQFTVINMITHMTNLPKDFLQDVCELILCDQHLSPKTTVKLIRLLQHRFLDERALDMEYLYFVKFLMNVAIDAVAIDKLIEERGPLEDQIVIADVKTVTEMDVSEQEATEGNAADNKNSSLSKVPACEDNQLKTMLESVQAISLYKVLPSVAWKRHSEIFEACLECLMQQQKFKVHSRCVLAFIREIYSVKFFLPVHSVIAILKIIFKFSLYGEYLYQDEGIRRYTNNLTTSSLLYLSIMLNRQPTDKLAALGVEELQFSLNLSRPVARDVLRLLTTTIYKQGMDVEKCLYIIRVIRFFIQKEYAFSEDISGIMHFLQAVENFCPDGSLQQALLYDIFNFLECSRE